MGINEIDIQYKAYEYAKENLEHFIDIFVLSKNPDKSDIISVFMAGAPGVGKTEFSQRYQAKLELQLKEEIFRTKQINYQKQIVIRIDPDEIRSYLPYYHKTDTQIGVTGNAHVVQTAVNYLTEQLRDFCINNGISILLDGTFGNNLITLKKLVKKSLERGRQVNINYIYLNPLKAWEFTHAREMVEGRNILKEKFIYQFFKSIKNTEQIKKVFGTCVKLDIIIKDESNQIRQNISDASSVVSTLKEAKNKGLIQHLFTEAELTNLIV